MAFEARDYRRELVKQSMVRSTNIILLFTCCCFILPHAGLFYAQEYLEQLEGLEVEDRLPLIIADDEMTTIQRGYYNIYKQIDFSQLYIDVGKAFWSCLRAADSHQADFSDTNRLPQDVQTGTGVVTDFILKHRVDQDFAVFETETSAARAAYKLRVAQALQRYVPDVRPFLDCLFGTQDPDRMASAAVYPYETSADDDSLVGIAGPVHYHHVPHWFRRLLSKCGLLLRQITLFVDCFKRILVARARMRTMNGQQVLAYYVGGVLEAAVNGYTNLDHDLELLGRFATQDPLLCANHYAWRLELPMDSFCDGRDFIEDCISPLSESPLPAEGEWNEYAGRHDTANEASQRFQMVCKQAAPCLRGLEQLYGELLEGLDSPQFTERDTGSLLIVKDSYRVLLVDVPSLYDAFVLACKHRVRAVLFSSRPEFDSLLDPPDQLVFPNEIYCGHGGSFTAYFPLLNSSLLPESRALCLIGSMILAFRVAFMRIGIAFRECKGLQKIARRENGSTFTLPGCFLADTLLHKMNLHGAERIGKHCGPIFMKIASDRELIPDERPMVFVFPEHNDYAPRIFAQNYPEGQMQN